uniref:Uncharacterized protein n=1 Tax=viral metagenome TaxID=1070528 RepID=A0A6M3JTY8_9ZZZZ
MKFFHELSKEEFKELVDKKITYGELATLHPQPIWCGYPDATHGKMGCWSLMAHMVTGDDFCKSCDLYTPHP